MLIFFWSSVLMLLFSVLTDICLPDADAATLPLNSSATAPSAQMNNTCPCLSATPTTAASSPSSSAPVVSLLTVHWTGKCEGSVRLYNSSTDFTPVCHSNSHTVLELLKNVCLNIKGCKGQPGLIKGSRNDGYDISEDGGEWMISCETLGVRCKGWSTVCVCVTVCLQVCVLVRYFHVFL